MTTHILEGFALVSGSSPTTFPVTLTIVQRPGADTFSYRVINQDGDLPEVEIDSDAVGLAFNSVSLQQLEYDPDFNGVFLGQITRSGGQVSQVVTFELDPDDGYIALVFQLGGDPIPRPTSAAEAAALEQSITSVGPIPPGTPLSANTPIAFSSLPNHSSRDENIILGTNGNDTLNGTSGNDLIQQGSNNYEDIVYGSEGHDIIEYIDSNRDSYYQLRYTNLDAPITVNINQDQGIAMVDKGDNGTDLLVDADRAYSYDTGDGLRIVGTTGDDVFNINFDSYNAGLGLTGGAGDDTYNISGTSYVRLAFDYDGDTSATSGLVADLRTGAVSNDGFGDSDQINLGADVERIEVRGTNLNDRITGSDRNEIFRSQGGNDTIDGGAGSDAIRYHHSRFGDIVANLATGQVTGTWDGQAFTDTLSNIEDLRGSRNGNDMITGSDAANYLRGEEGNDTLYGGNGNDTLRGEEGNDSLDGGAGFDVAAYWNYRRSDLTITEGAAGDATIVSSTGTDVLHNIEELQFQDGSMRLEGRATPTAGDDLLTGTEDGEEIRGEAGNDTLIGLGGGDSLYGGTGDDSLDGGDGADWFYADAGNDTLMAGTDGSRDRLTFINAPTGVSADLQLGTASDGFGGTDTLFGTFRLIGSNYNDTLRGNAEDNSFTGELGDDIIDGRDGDDFVFYGRAASAVQVNLGTGVVTGGEGNDTLTSIEAVSGSNFSDTLVGSDGDNWFMPDADGDPYTNNYQVGGDDTVDGGAGVDGVSYWNATNGVVANLSTGQATDGLGNTDTLRNIENLEGSEFNDRLTGDAGANDLEGQDGNDTLIGGAGDDELSGGDGTDVLNGGDGNDTIYGGDSELDLRDVVYAGAGDDMIEGGYGNDELRGDAGNDNIAGGFGADTVIGGTGNDTLTGSAWGDEIFGGDGMDFINGGFGFDRVNGGDGGDRFFHLGVRDHGADWIQDYDASEGDVLVYGGGAGAASASDFLVQRANTASAGSASVEEVFITHVPSGTLMWALVDGDAQSELNIVIGGQTYDLLA